MVYRLWLKDILYEERPINGFFKRLDRKTNRFQESGHTLPVSFENAKIYKTYREAESAKVRLDEVLLNYEITIQESYR